VLLIAAGADVNYKHIGVAAPALFRAVNIDNYAGAKLLLENGADTNITINSEGFKPLHYVRSVPMIDLLIKHGAAVNAKDHNGNTFLIILAQGKKDDLSFYQSAINHGSDPTLTNKKGKTDIDYAKESKLNSAVVDFLQTASERIALMDQVVVVGNNESSGLQF